MEVGHRLLADASGEHMATFLSVVWVGLFLGVGAFLYKAADRALVPWHTALLAGLGAFSMCAIVVVAPFDLALTLVARRAEADSTRVEFFLPASFRVVPPRDAARSRRSFERHSRTLQHMYATVYWVCFAMSLVALPYAEEYTASGHVATLGRALDAGRRMAMMWAAMAVAGAGERAEHRSATS